MQREGAWLRKKKDETYLGQENRSLYHWVIGSVWVEGFSVQARFVAVDFFSMLFLQRYWGYGSMDMFRDGMGLGGSFGAGAHLSVLNAGGHGKRVR